MKFLNCGHIKKDLYEIKVFLLGKGILVKSTDDFINIPIRKSVAKNIKRGIFVVLNYQYDDAYQLLRNKKHKVSKPLSGEQMDLIESKSKKQFFILSQRFFERLAVIILVIFILGFCIYVIKGIIT